MRRSSIWNSSEKRGPAEAALGDLPVGRAVEGQTPVLQFVDRLHGLLAHQVGRVLIHQIVAALDRVEGVPLWVVFFQIAQRRADAALRRAAGGLGWIQLAIPGAVRPGLLHRRAQTRAARA